MCFMDIQLSIPASTTKIARKTPMETKSIRRVTIELDDGTELELSLEENSTSESGFYRVNDYVRNGRSVTIHEVFLTYGNS